MDDPLEIARSINEELGFAQLNDTHDEAYVKSVIADRVSELLDHDPGLLFSYMYRLDVLESKIKNMLLIQKNVPPHIGLANLIWERQKQRLAHKQKFKTKPIDGWEW